MLPTVKKAESGARNANRQKDNPHPQPPYQALAWSYWFSFRAAHVIEPPSLMTAMPSASLAVLGFVTQDTEQMV